MLGLPEGFRQAFHEDVEGGVGIAHTGDEPPIAFRKSVGLGDGELLGHREMEREMEERIGLARGRVEVAFEIALGVVEQNPVFRMQVQDVEHLGFEGRQGFAGLGFPPGFEEQLPRLPTVGGEHQARAKRASTAEYWKSSER